MFNSSDSVNKHEVRSVLTALNMVLKIEDSNNVVRLELTQLEGFLVYSAIRTFLAKNEIPSLYRNSLELVSDELNQYHGDEEFNIGMPSISYELVPDILRASEHLTSVEGVGEYELLKNNGSKS